MPDIWEIEAIKKSDLEARITKIPDDCSIVLADTITSSQFKDVPEDVEFTFFVTPLSGGFIISGVNFNGGQPDETTEVSYDGWQEIHDIWLAPEELTVLEVLRNIIEKEGYENIQYKGPSGLGKSSRAQAFAKSLGLDFCKVNCGSIISPRDWFVTREVREGETITELTEMAEKVKEGNSLICLDDLNRTNQHGSIFSMLDDSRQIHVLHERFDLGPNVIFVATINEGWQYRVHPLDVALQNRFGITLEASYPPYWVEVQILMDRHNIPKEEAMNIVSKFTNMREVSEIVGRIDVTTRPALNIAKLVSHGMSMYDAFKACLVNGRSGEAVKRISDSIEGLKNGRD